MNSNLAIYGGTKIRSNMFPANITTGHEELLAVQEVLESGVLSNYLGTAHENFMGGRSVRELEEIWSKYFSVDYSFAVNSNTSGIIAAIGACGIGPGDEVIVSPYSMSISAIAPIFWGATPVFADVEPDHFCVSIDSIEKLITPKTKAIIVVDLFGNTYDAERINAVANKHGIYVIEDCAQAPLAKLNGKFAGTLGDIGVFSLNYHKHIQTGEGGVVVTNNSSLAERVALIRNHAEAVVNNWPDMDFPNAIGYNFRMTEIDAAIAKVQLEKLSAFVERRLYNIQYLEDKLSAYSEFKLPKKRKNSQHVYYQHALIWDDDELSRDKFVDAVKAELPCFEAREKEGVKIGGGYVKPLYLLPLFQKRNGNSIVSRALEPATQQFSLGLCPTVERLHFKTLITHEFMVPSMKISDLDDVVDAFDKVISNKQSLI